MARLYAIVGNMERARLMLEAGVPYLQLRFKVPRFKEPQLKEEELKEAQLKGEQPGESSLEGSPLDPHRLEIAGWPGAFPSTKVIINDDLDFAESVGVWGVHLGQEDVCRYDPAQLLNAPLNVGISTHSDGEIAHALTFKPALLGFGPVFPTTTKEVGHPSQGVERLREIVESIEVPVVAIGGINDENMTQVVATGVPLVAMIAYLDRTTTVSELHQLMEALEGK